MMYVQYVGVNRTHTFSIHIGNSIDCNVLNVLSVQADGDELDYIQAWKNMPDNGCRVQHFFGDHAKYIAANWQRGMKPRMES